MHVKIDDKKNASVFRISGDINMSTSPDVKNSFRQMIKDKKLNIVVDLSSVNYIDSSGLATFVEILKEMRVYGGKLKLSGLSPKVQGLFEITKLNKLFEIKQNESEALNSF